MTRLVALLMLLWPLSAHAQFGPPQGPPLTNRLAVAKEGGVVKVAIEFSLPAPWHMNSHTPLEEFLIPTELTLGEGAPGLEASFVYPPHKEEKFAFSEKPLAVYTGKFVLGALLKSTGNLPASMGLVLHYQACNDKQCLPPVEKEIRVSLGPDAPVDDALIKSVDWARTAGAAAAAAPEATPPAAGVVAAPAGNWQELIKGFEITADTGYVSTEEFISFIRKGKGQAGAEESRGIGALLWSLLTGGGVAGDLLGTLGAPLLIVVVLVGGFALNLTPCVLPLIPINIGIIGAGARAGSKAKGFALGGAFGAGIALAYGALGLLVVLGLSTAFGGMNSTVWFNAAIAVLFVALGLAMFDVINIDFSRYQASVGIRGNKGGSFAVAFAMGVISALLAGACVAPVVIQTILYSQDLYAKGNVVALALPFLLGVGMALPWPFAGGGLSFLPKPGAWMTRVKQAFGVFILAFAAWYGYEAWHIWDQKHVDPEAVRASVEALNEEGWLTSLEEGLAQAKAEGKPLFVDFWATWCKNCLVMNQTVLKDPAVLAELDGVVKVKFQAEDFSKSPVKEIAEHFKLVGLPAYFMLRPVP